MVRVLALALLAGTSSIFGATTVGWVENARLTLTDTTGRKRVVNLEAKVDTGARTSSLHALEVKEISRDGKPFVRFKVSLGGERFEMEAPVRKEASVKSSEGTGEERPFVEIEACLGSSKERLLVSLNDRTKMHYPLLLGRRFLESRFLVDSGNKFLLGKPSCR